MPGESRCKAKFIPLLCICLLVFTSCAGDSGITLPVLEDYDTRIDHEELTHIRVGFVAGPYEDMFTETIEPLMARMGYSFEMIVYDNYFEPNFALADGEIDINIFQHYQYLNNFRLHYDLDLAAISEMPTAAMGIYSNEYTSLYDIKNGAAIAIPNDSTNLSRALAMLSAVGYISVDPNVEAMKLALEDVMGNPHDLRFVTTDAQSLFGSLGECDMSIINGNFALNGGLELSDALYLESLTNHEYINVIVIRSDDTARQFVMDLMAVLRSKEYVRAITREDGKYCRFQYPCNFSIYGD